MANLFFFWQCTWIVQLNKPNWQHQTVTEKYILVTYHSNLLVLKISFCQYLVWLIAVLSPLSPEPHKYQTLEIILFFTMTFILQALNVPVFCLGTSRVSFLLHFASRLRKTILYVRAAMTALKIPFNFIQLYNETMRRLTKSVILLKFPLHFVYMNWLTRCNEIFLKYTLSSSESTI